jgi:hypothetical protein
MNVNVFSEYSQSHALKQKMEGIYYDGRLQNIVNINDFESVPAIMDCLYATAHNLSL